MSEPSAEVVAAVRQAMADHWGADSRVCICGRELRPDESLVSHHRESVARAAEAAALEAAADTWQRGAWGDTPRKADRVADRIAAANHVTAWLRERAGEVRGDE